MNKAPSIKKVQIFFRRVKQSDIQKIYSIVFKYGLSCDYEDVGEENVYIRYSSQLNAFRALRRNENYVNMSLDEFVKTFDVSQSAIPTQSEVSKIVEFSEIIDGRPYALIHIDYDIGTGNFKINEKVVFPSSSTEYVDISKAKINAYRKALDYLENSLNQY